MGWGAALKLRELLDNLAGVLAVELLCAGHGLDLRAPLQPAPATAAARDLLRAHVAGPGPDRPLAPDLAAAKELVRSGALVERVTAVAGELR
jgi:histidine ammonia-lyase